MVSRETFDKLLEEAIADEKILAIARPEPEHIPDEPEHVPEDDIGKDACKWLDAYIAFSKFWSPRAYEGYHEAIALWLLSTIAQRRTMLNVGGKRYGNLYIIIVAPTSTFAKTTTAKIAKNVLHDCGLEFLLAHSESTPQAFIKNLSTPRTADKESENINEDRLALRGGRGWYYEEFGGKIAQILKENGGMSEYRSLFRQFDDCPANYSYETISRGLNKIESPYLALLAIMTPSDLRRAGKANDSMWGDGFWARFNFICPQGKELNLERFPPGEPRIPNDIIRPLMQWNERLGWPKVNFEELEDDDGKPTNRVEVIIESKLPEVCTITKDALNDFYDYHDVMTTEVYEGDNEDFAGTYIRSAEKALRIAILLASLENNGQIEQRHFARGKRITERWRLGLQNLYFIVNQSDEEKVRGKHIKVVEDLGNPTAREVGRRLHTSAKDAEIELKKLVELEIIMDYHSGKTIRYSIPKRVLI